MIQNNKQNTVAFICHFDCFYTGLRARSGENITSHGNIYHTFADKTADSRLMAGTTQSDDRNAVSIFQFIIYNQVAIFKMDDILIGKSQTFQ